MGINVVEVTDDAKLVNTTRAITLQWQTTREFGAYNRDAIDKSRKLFEQPYWGDRDQKARKKRQAAVARAVVKGELRCKASTKDMSRTHLVKTVARNI